MYRALKIKVIMLIYCIIPLTFHFIYLISSFFPYIHKEYIFNRQIKRTQYFLFKEFPKQYNHYSECRNVLYLYFFATFLSYFSVCLLPWLSAFVLSTFSPLQEESARFKVMDSHHCITGGDTSSVGEISTTTPAPVMLTPDILMKIRRCQCPTCS